MNYEELPSEVFSFKVKWIFESTFANVSVRINPYIKYGHLDLTITNGLNGHAFQTLININELGISGESVDLTIKNLLHRYCAVSIEQSMYFFEEYKEEFRRKIKVR